MEKVEIPILDENLLCYIRNPAEKNAAKITKRMNKEKIKLETLFSKYQTKINKLQKEYLPYEIGYDQQFFFPHHIQYLINYQHKLIDKDFKEKKQLINSCLEKISQVIGYQSFCFQKNICAFIEFRPLKKYFESISQSTNKKYSNKISRISAKINFLIPNLLKATPNLSLCRSFLANSLPSLQSNRYVTLDDNNKFDTFFPLYIRFNHRDPDFIPIIQRISQSEDFTE